MIKILPLLLLSTVEPTTTYNDKVVCQQCMFYDMPAQVVQFPKHGTEIDGLMLDDFFNRYNERIVKKIEHTPHPFEAARYRLHTVLPNIVTEVISEYTKFPIDKETYGEPHYYTDVITLTLHHNGMVESDNGQAN